MLEIVKTADGSNTIFNAEVGENYHSKHGALQESRHVFVNSGLRYFLETRQAPSKSPPVGETFLPGGETLPVYLRGTYRETADPVYYEQLKDFSRENRKNPTEAENLLWQLLRKEQTGYKIRRQHAISQFIADFVCLQKGLIIELDGHHHKLNKEADDARTEILNYFGFTVIRFDNDIVLQSPQLVFNEIKEKLNSLANRDLTKIIKAGPTQPSPVERALKITASEAKVSPTGGDLEGACISILEVGFGTGLNFLLSAELCGEKNIELNYTGIEAYPLSPEMTSQTGYNQYLKPEIWNSFIEKYPDSLTAETCVAPNCKLHIAHCKLLDFAFKKQYDIIYFDAFAAMYQPEMWDETAINHTIQFLKPGGVFVTYAITGNLKRALKSLGCKVEKAPGAPGKREMLRAVKVV